MSLSKSESLTHPIQIQLSQNQKIFSRFFSAFPKSTSNFEYFEEEDEPQRLLISEIIDFKKRAYLNAYKAPCQNTYGQRTC